MASCSSSWEENDGDDPCNAIASQYVSKTTAEFPVRYHTFINYHGLDVRYGLGSLLYDQLQHMGLRPFLDKSGIEGGDGIANHIRNGTLCGSVHIAIFSPRYADSWKCLDELYLMLKAGYMIIPVFYGVKPSELRYIQKGCYMRRKWKDALYYVSFLYGYELKPDGNDMGEFLQMLGNAVLEEVEQSISLDAGERLVGLDEIQKYSERKCVSSSFSAYQGTRFGRKESASSSRSFDLFINHRGPDVKRTLASSLYHQLKRMGCRAFLDNQEIKLGDLVPLVLQDAISCASLHVVIFSEQYAQSPWCLDELVFMLETGTKIIPVFYGVEPWHLRSTEKGVYAQAFVEHERKNRYNSETIQKWRNALITVSQFVEHCRFKPGDDMVEIVDKISRAVVEEVQKEVSLCIAEHPVGLNEIVDDLERQCGLKSSEHANIIGIFGMPGSGKTTLAKELFNRKHSQYNSSCFLFNVRDESSKGELPSLQNKLLRNLLYEDHPTFQSVSEGSSYLRDRLKMISISNFFIVLDDIDSTDQLEDLLCRDLASFNSLVIVTTRDEDLLIRAGITLRYSMKEMDERHSSELFCWHAFHRPDPVAGYEDLVQRSIKVCGGFPISLRVLGGYAFGKSDKHDWQSGLDKFSKASPESIRKILEISTDALDEEQKQIFMDIACFFVGKSKRTAIRIWEASGWRAEHALHILKDRCLVDVGRNYAKGFEYEDKIVFKMHDQLRDLGRKMAVEESSPRREWQPQHLKSLELKRFQNILMQRNDCNLRCFISIFDSSTGSQTTYFLGNSRSDFDKTSTALLWIDLKLNGSEHDSIPPWIPLHDLPCIRIAEGRLGRLWHSNVQAPFLLKELLLHKTSLEDC